MEVIDVLMVVLSASSVVYILSALISNAPPLDVQHPAEDPSVRAAVVIREIEFDYSAGKLSKEDFETVRTQAVAELAAALKKKETL